MNRVWDYIDFAFWFAGLGYIVLWLFGSPAHLMLSPGLHAIGLAAAAFVPFRLLLYALARRRAAASAGAATVVPARTPPVVLRVLQRKPVRPLRPVKPRSHFGLRGIPH